MSKPPPDNRPRWTRGEVMILVAILLYALVVRAVLIDQPFTRNPEGTGVLYALLARNYLRVDVGRSLGVPVLSMGDRADVPVTFYANHPPGVPLLIAGVYALFGDGEWQTRLPAALFTLGNVVLVHVLLRNRGRPRAGLVAAAVFAAMPMTIYYGSQPDCINAQLVFFILLTLAAYQQFHDQPTAKRLGLLCLAFAPAAYTDWPAFYVVPVVSVHYAITKHPRAWGWMVPFGLFAIAAFVLVYAQLALALDDWGWMTDKVARRAISTQSDRETVFGWREWLAGAARHNVGRHTIPVLLLAGLWIATLGWRVRRTDPAAALVRLVLAVALLHVLVGRQAVYVHDWWWWPLTPGLALASGLLIDRAMDRFATTRRRQQSATIATAALLIGFATWTTITTLPGHFDRDATHGGLDASTIEVGQALRLAGPTVNSAVMLAYDERYDLPMWYYADRPLKLGVWDMPTLERRMTDGTADLPFGFTQSWPDPPTGLVLPRQFIPFVPEWTEQLKARFGYRELDKFLVFDLRDAREASPDTRVR